MLLKAQVLFKILISKIDFSVEVTLWQEKGSIK